MDQHSPQLAVGFHWRVLMLGFEVAPDGDDELINFSASVPTRPPPTACAWRCSRPDSSCPPTRIAWSIRARADNGRQRGSTSPAEATLPTALADTSAGASVHPPRRMVGQPAPAGKRRCPSRMDGSTQEGRSLACESIVRRFAGENRSFEVAIRTAHCFFESECRVIHAVGQLVKWQQPATFLLPGVGDQKARAF